MHQDNYSQPPEVPAALVSDRMRGWRAFTQFTVWNCIAVAATVIVVVLLIKF